MVMDFLCCDPLDDRDSGSDGSITCSTDEGILECDYDTQVTKLYHTIEERQWEEVLYFLDTGKWYNTSIFSAFAEQGDSPSVQTRTWVTALDEARNVRWCQLPLHAAVTFLAPFSVIQKLVEVYPKSVRCADDQDMLPLHYAFRFGAEDDVLAHLLGKFPQAIGKVAVKDRLPLDLAQYGPRPERGSIIDIYMQSAVRNAKSEWDVEYEKIVSSTRKKADSELKKELNVKNYKLGDALDELARTRKELQLLQRENNQEKRESRLLINNNASMRSTTKSLNTTKSLKSTKSGKSSKPSSSSSTRKVQIQRANEDTDTTHKAPRRQSRLPAAKVLPVAKVDDSTSVRTGLGKLFGKRKK
jgi:hypothetical protein